MELRQLRYVAAVARYAHFTRAAEEVHVAHSAISHQVAKLESELGVELFARSRRTVRLTQAGEIVLARANRILGEVRALEAEIAELGGLLRGRITLGGMIPLGPLDIAELLSSFHERHPRVEVSLMEATTQRLHTLVHRGDIDLALTLAMPDGFYADLAGEILFEEEFVVIAGASHPLGAASGPVRTDQLGDHGLIAFHAGSTTRDVIDQHLTAAGVTPRIAFESSLVDVSRRLASRGLGAAILPRSTVEAAGPPVTIRSLSPRLARPVTLIWRRDQAHSPAGTAMIEHVRAAAAAVPA
jgi:DNA-binding transcriptional LysR family regulator